MSYGEKYEVANDYGVERNHWGYHVEYAGHRRYRVDLCNRLRPSRAHAVLVRRQVRQLWEVSNMIIVVTGHRPQSLTCGFNDTHPQRLHIEDEIRRYLRAQKARYGTEVCLGCGRSGVSLMSGMALGVDQWTARIAIEEGIPLVAVVPCATQPGRWSAPQQAAYRALLDRATHVHVLQEHYDAGCMTRRNVWMVDQIAGCRCNNVLAVWDGKESGGTHHCVKYATLQGVHIERIDPTILTHRRRAEMAMRELRTYITPELLDVLARTQETLWDVMMATRADSGRDDGSVALLALWNKIDVARNNAKSAHIALELLAKPR